ncbi:hypothetical protein ALI22I_01130, partial [Saccharothrix sp. ALI-22-I]
MLSLTPLKTRVAIADSKSAGTWVDGFELVSGPGDVPAAITLAVGVDGTGAACITSLSSTDVANAQWRHRVVYRPAGAAQWEQPVEIVGFSGASRSVRVTDVAVAPNGVAVVLADRYDAPPDARIGSLFVSSHSPGGSWTTPQQVTSSVSGAAELGLDAAGNATIAWVHRWQTVPSMLHSIRVVTRTAAGAISPQTALTKESGSANSLSLCLAVNASGAAALGTQVISQASQANVTTRPSQTGSWGPFAPLFTDATAASSAPRSVAVSPGGTSYALYWRQGPFVVTNDVIGMSRCAAGGAWVSPTNLSVPNMQMSNGLIAMYGEDAIAVYTGAIGFGGGNPGIEILQAGRWRSSAPGPEAPVDLVPQGTRRLLTQVIGDNAGSVVVTETVFGGTTPRTFVLTFDRVLPIRFRLVDAGPANAVVFSRDGFTVATAGSDNTARLFHTSNGQQRFTVTHTAPVNAVAFSPNGLAVATASDDKTARLTTIGGTETLRLTHDDRVTTVTMSADGLRLATGSADGTARIAEPGSTNPPRTLDHDGAVHAVAFSPDGTRLATACNDGTARLFNTQTGAQLLTFPHDGPVHALAFTPDGTRLATACHDGTARLF